MNGILALLCLAVVGSSLLGGLLPLWTVLNHTRLQLYLSVSAGAMLGAAFFHMMPEAVEQSSPSVLSWTAAGLLALFFVERFFAFHHHEAPHDPADPCPTHAHEHPTDPQRGHAAGLVSDAALGSHNHNQRAKSASIQWGAAGIGLSLHSLTGGIALASAWVVGVQHVGETHAEGQEIAGGMTALGVALATVIHKPADSLTIISLMLRAGMPAWKAHAVNAAFALMVPLGVLLFFWGVQWLSPGAIDLFSARALAFSAGTFLCIALSDLLPELQFHNHDRIKLSAALLLGFAIMALTELAHRQLAHAH